MPTRSKFVAPVRAQILQLLAAGASRRTAAMAAGVDHRTLGRWIERGETAHPEGRWHQFYLDVLEAEAAPRLRALKIVHDALPDDPGLAWKFTERQVDGFGPPGRQPPAPAIPPMTIDVVFVDARPPDLGESEDD
jgi:hypothetical protein